MASRRSTAIRQVSRWPRRPSDFDRWPGWLLLLLGLLPGLALGWLAIQSTIATGLLILLLIPAAGRAGWRPRLVWDEHSLPVGLQPDSDGGQSLPESPTPPYPRVSKSQGILDRLLNLPNAALVSVESACLAQ
jgi:hypothetical protein